MHFTNTEIATLKKIEQFLVKLSADVEMVRLNSRILEDARTLRNLRNKIIRAESERTFFLN